MATSIIKYKDKYIDVNDNILILGLYFIKKVAINKDLPDWFKKYIKKVIDVIIDIKPIGWGYMELEKYLSKDEERKLFFLEILNATITYLKRHKSDIIDNIEVNYILNLKDIEIWNENDYIKTEYVIKFLKDVKIILNDNTPLNHPRLMKIRNKK